MIQIELETSFSCAHFYSQSKWSDQKNRETFGKCYSQYGHGHDYRLQVSIRSEESNFAQHEAQLKSLLIQIHEEFDHKHLNFDFSEFKNRIPTTENISLVIAEKLKSRNPGLQFIQLRLYEHPDLFVETVFVNQ